MTNKKKFIEMLNFEEMDGFLALTFEFRDDMLWKLAGNDKHKSKNTLLEVKPVVFYDARKTKECRSSPLFLEHHPVPVSNGLHHSKAYCTIKGKKAQLYLGSANLTRQGLTMNRETLASFTELGILRQFLDFLNEHYKYVSEGHSDYHQFKTKLGGLCSQASIDPASKLITNGYGTKGLTQLSDYWNSFEKSPAKRILVVSPYFDVKERFVFDQFIADRLIDKSTEFSLVAEFQEESKFPLGRSKVEKIKNNTAAFNVYQCKKSIESDSNEWNEIKDANKERKIKSDTVIERRLHSKIILLEGENGLYIYIGSANFTSRAWVAQNRELGIIKKIDKAKFEDLVESISSELCACLTKLSILKLPEIVEIDEDEIELGVGSYPDFIESFLLKFNDKKLPFFELTIKDDPKQLDDYQFEWGETSLERIGLILNFSQEVFSKNIVGQRNITVINKNGSKYYIPFKFSEYALDNLTNVYFKNSDEWLTQTDGKGLFTWDYTPIDEGEGSPRDNDTGLDYEEDLGIDRNANLTIKMQNYMNLFDIQEKLFLSKVESYKKEDKKIIFNERDSIDLKHFITLLYNELLINSIPDVELFKLGEVTQLLKKAYKLYRTDEIKNLHSEVVEFIKEYILRKKLQDKAPYKQYLGLLNENI